MLDNKHIYSFASEPWETPEDAQDQAASQALAHLQKLNIAEIHDYSFAVLEKVRQRNRLVTSEIQAMARMIIKLLPGYTSMAAEVLSAYEKFGSQVPQQPLPVTDDNNVAEINQLIQDVALVPTLLRNLHREMIKQIFPLYRDCKFDVENCPFAVNQSPNTGRNPAVPVVISNVFMLNELLTMTDCSSPTYLHVQCLSGKIISCCQFYSTNSYPPDADPYVIPGKPCDTTLQADEDSSQKALEFMDAQMHTQLRDYNYDMKEDMLTFNRELITQAQELMMMIKSILLYWKRHMEELRAIKNSMKDSVTNALVLANDPDIIFHLRSIANSVIDIDQQLRHALEQGSTILGQYDIATLQKLQWTT
ncbi:hypothetical protein EJB05_10290 [Eragrostis curvula]|uniref:Uncharacterized protein n=1 Tax=Eragrostis curvula TaxID=38414 RepID=A0A5J9W765_9POAL|nr:hypothetical protein EJB05_10290 [Eragrostis curvula]